jgi:hypothetical protein
MTPVAAQLGLLACLSMAGAAYGATIPARHEAICYGGRDAPKEAPDRPAGCHAAMSCAEHRRLRIFP